MLQSKHTDWHIRLKRKKERKKKQESTICCLQEIHFRAKDTHRLKVMEWKKMFQTEMT